MEERGRGLAADRRHDACRLFQPRDVRPTVELKSLTRSPVQVAVHAHERRNLYWRTSEGLQLDGGAYVAGLEEAASVMATICGKPASAFFHAALDTLGIGPQR